MSYEMPQNVTSFVDLISWTDSAVGGWFGASVLGVFFVVMFLANKKQETKNAFAVAGFMTALVGAFLRALDIINDRSVIVAVVIAAIGLLWLVWDRD
jgi:lipid-A-disaccharide synthase-like uncharacterized protein|tara:strand:- start:1638 stop:1928 length:291 start_codon:yes stop_codon:yes gene_type:complete